MASHGSEPPPGGPLSLDLLADLHAGVLPPSASEELWPRVHRDARAMEIMAALDAVSTRLAESRLAESRLAESCLTEVPGGGDTSGESIPPVVAERIDRALASADMPESVASVEDTYAPVTALTSRRRIPRRAVAFGVAASVAAAVALAAVVVAVAQHDGGAGEDVIAQNEPAEPSTLVIGSGDLDAAVAYEVMARPVDDDVIEPGKLPGCLVANGFGPTSMILGSAPIELDGQRGVMLVVPRTPPGAGLTLLAVTPDCGAGNPGTIIRRDID